MLQLPCKLNNQLIHFLLKPANVSSKHSSIDFSRAKSKVIYLTSTIKLLTLKKLLLHKCKLFLMCVLFLPHYQYNKNKYRKQGIGPYYFHYESFHLLSIFATSDPNAKICLYLYAISKIR